MEVKISADAKSYINEYKAQLGLETFDDALERLIMTAKSRRAALAKYAGKQAKEKKAKERKKKERAKTKKATAAATA